MAGPLEAWALYWTGDLQPAITLQTLLLSWPTVALFFLFPNGRFVPSWTRPLLVLAVPWSLSLLLVGNFDAPSLAGLSPLELGLLMLWFTGFLVIALYAQVHRYRRVSSPVERLQTKWVMFGFSLWIGYILLSTGPYMVISSLPPGAPIPWWARLSELAWFLALSIIPVSLTVAVARYDLWDIDLVINRTLVYGAVTAAIIGLYALVVGGAALLFQAQGNWLIALVATGLVAVLFQPLRTGAQRWVNQLLYGRRDEPFEVLARLGQRLEDTIAPELVLPTMVETVAQTLKLPYVAIAMREGNYYATSVSYGKPATSTVVFPLTHQGEQIGQLVVARRAADEDLSVADERLLRNVARQAGTAVHAIQLTADLQHARRQIVTSREEERRRLRRDLHDGLGPSLAAQLLKIGAARALLADRPDVTNKLLAEMERDIDGTLAEVRRIVYDLRPPALDQWGLAGALRAYAETCEGGAGGDAGATLTIDVAAPETLLPLPAAVEVAAYHIGRDALTNVVRHAQARHCTLRLAVDEGESDCLVLTIHDDGQGFGDEVDAGVGLAGMRERAAELDGSCTVESVPGAGTRVTAKLPLGA